MRFGQGLAALIDLVGIFDRILFIQLRRPVSTDKTDNGCANRNLWDCGDSDCTY
jgi:hypothetical protein